MRSCDLKITVLPHLGLATATPCFHLRFVSPPNVVPPKPRSASSEAFGRPVTLPRQDGLFLFGARSAARAPAGGSRCNQRREPAPIHGTTNPMTELEVTGLSCRRGGRPVVRNISFTLGRGELLALTGRNGSGKTTLLRALALLVTADAGGIRWQGTDVRHDRDGWCRQIAWLGHLDGLKGDLTVVENLATACH